MSLIDAKPGTIVLTLNEYRDMCRHIGELERIVDLAVDERVAQRERINNLLPLVLTPSNEKCTMCGGTDSFVWKVFYPIYGNGADSNGLASYSACLRCASMTVPRGDECVGCALLGGGMLGMRFCDNPLVSGSPTETALVEDYKRLPVCKDLYRRKKV